MKDKCKKIYNILLEEYGKIDCPLHHKSNFQLMIAVMLSAQSTDIAVNKITPILFNNYPDVITLSKANLTITENIIHPLGLYHNKAKNILAASNFLLKNFDGKIPNEIDQLIKIPGIGRKTANVIVTHAFNKPGFAVDTHVKRLLNRIGIVNFKNPDKIEFVVKKLITPEKLGNFSLLLITHGRKCCNAKKPNCHKCIIREICKTGKEFNNF
jgi:endonuclease III